MVYEELIENIKTVLCTVENARIRAGRIDCITVVGASKTMPYEVVEMVDKCHLLKALGENRAQEFRDKYREGHNFDWHFIGTLQSNKIKYIVGKVKLIESVDTVDLARDISEYALKHGVSQEILLQVNMGKEENKFGFFPEDIDNAIATISKFEGVKVVGIMAVMPNVEENTLISFYRQLNSMYSRLRKVYNFKYLSAGMTNDYHLAIEFGGANIVRIGRAIFGDRV